MVNEGPVDPKRLMQALGMEPTLDAEAVADALNELASRDMQLLEVINSLGELGSDQNRTVKGVIETLLMQQQTIQQLDQKRKEADAARGFAFLLTIINFAGMLYLLFR